MINSTFPKRIIFITSGVLLLIIQSWVGFITFHFPYAGIEVKANDKGIWKITEFYKDSTAQYMGLVINDEIIYIDDKPANEHTSVYKFHSIEKARFIEVKRNGLMYIYDLGEIHTGFSSRVLFALTAEIILFLFAAFLSFKTKHSRTSYYLIVMLTLMGIAFMCAEGAARSDTLANFLISNTMSFIPFLLAQFIHHFLIGKGYKMFHPRWLTSGFVLLSAIAVSRITYFLNAPIYTFYVIDRFLTLFCFAGGSLIVLVLLVSIYRKNRLEYSFSAMIIKIVFQAFTMSFVPFLLLSVVPDLFGKPIVHYSRAMWFILLFPIIFAFFAIKYKLLRNKNILRSLFPGNQQQMISFNRILVEHEQNLALSDIEDYILPQICTTLGFDAIAIRIHDRGNIQLAVHGLLDSEEIEQAVLFGNVSDMNYAVYTLHPKYDFTSHLVIKRPLPYKGISVAKQSCIDVLIAWLAITLENIYLSERLSMKVEELFSESAASLDQSGEHYLWFRNTLYQMQEKERRRIAAELHDTVMQDIYFAKQRVAAIRKGPLKPSVRDNELKELADYLDIINSNLRDTNFQLYPHLLKEVGITETISNLVEYERLNVPFQLHVKIEPKIAWDQLDSDTHHHLFRIMQELISNAKKHSHATEVKLHLLKIGQAMTLEYVDNGVGFNDKTFHEGAGLLGIQHRVSSLEGRLHMQTSVNSGLTLTITLSDVGGKIYEAGN